MSQEYAVPTQEFQLKGTITKVEQFGCGHINRTYRVSTDAGCEYLLQRVNTDIFPNIDGLMENIRLVTEHIRKKILAEGGDPERETMYIIPTKDDRLFIREEDGCWRCFTFIQNTVTLQSVRTPEDFYLTARAFGKFQQQLRDFPAETLCAVIPDFHNTPRRLENLWKAQQEDVMGRAKEVQAELDFIRQRTEFAAVLENALADGRVPLAVTHNDTKLNNLLFDAKTMQPIAVVDLDTVMPGLALYDFGDSIRFGAASAAEDEKDLSKVYCDLELFEAFTRGWMEACGDGMGEEERRLLPLAGRVMTLECGARFLTDYLQGDTYFTTHYPGQNLDRCRTQLKLVKDMEEKEAAMTAIVEQYT